MYQLVSRIKEGLVELKPILGKHICEQGKTAIAKCADVAANVCLFNNILYKLYVLYLYRFSIQEYTYKRY